jgi:hypothetical protein
LVADLESVCAERISPTNIAVAARIGETCLDTAVCGIA